LEVTVKVILIIIRRRYSNQFVIMFINYYGNEFKKTF